MAFTADDFDDLMNAAQGLRETHAAPEDGPYQLHDIIPDEGKLAEFLEIMVPLARAMTGTDVAAVTMAATDATQKLNQP